MVFVFPIQLSNSPRDVHPRVVLAKARTHSHRSSWLRRAGASTLVQQSTAVEMGPGSSPGRQWFCSSDSTVKQRRGYTSALSRRDAPELWVTFHPLERRGRRESRVRAAPAVSCANCAKKRTRAYRFSGNTPAFPARWVTAYFELSPVTGLFCHRRLADTSAKLDASIGAPGPHDFTVRNSAVRRARYQVARRRCSVHRISTRVRDDSRSAPRPGEMGRAGTTDLPDGLSEMFFSQGAGRPKSPCDQRQI